MKYLLVFVCLGLLVGCSSELVKPRGTPLAGPDGHTSAETEGRLQDPMPNSERKSPEASPTKIPVGLEDYGPAPELTNEVWLNVDHPLRLADLRGKVVLLEMWTFG